MKKRFPYARPTSAVVNRRLLRDNWNTLRSVLPKTTGILAIVKANAYGHGSIEFAKECHRLGAVGMGVADFAEAIVLREGGYKGTVLCLGDVPKSALPEALRLGIIVTLHSMEQLNRIASFTKGKPKSLRAHIKLDTGMRRLGFLASDWEAAWKAIAEIRNLKVEGIFTHLAEPYNLDTSFTDRQLREFREGADFFEKNLKTKLLRHAANSGGILRHPQSHFDWVRPGIALYGYPSPTIRSHSAQLKPILHWKAPLVEVKRIQVGDTVSYDRTFRASHSILLGVAAVGYGDGFRRGFANTGIGFRGKRCRILGIVCMDLMMIDLSEFPDAQAGEEIVLMGDPSTGAASAEDLARAQNTIAYEVLTGISARVSRVYR